MFDKNKKKIDWDYEFETINPTDFKLKIWVNINHPSIRGNRVLMKSFNMTRNILAKRYGKSVKGDPNVIKSFKIPDQYGYYKVINVATNQPLKDIKSQLYCDNIKVFSFDICEAEFKRDDNDDWNIIVNYNGQYNDMRRCCYE